MKITPNQKFRHDGQTYEEGQEYDVSDELGQYFTNVGWVGDDRELAIRNHNRPASDLGLIDTAELREARQRAMAKLSPEERNALQIQ